MNQILLLQCLLYMNFNGQPAPHFTTEHCFAKNSGSQIRAYNHVCNKPGVTQNEVEDIKHFFGATPFAWFVPTDDYQTIYLLQAQGLTKVAEFPALCADILTLPANSNAHTVTVTHAESENDIAIWNSLVASVYRYDPLELARATDYLRHAGGDAIQLYLGWHENKAACAGMAIYHHDIVTLHKVGTLPEYRNRGFGYTLTHTILSEALHAGCTSALLIATPMGKSLYDQFGFSRCGSYYVYALITS